ncbi:ABC multidrug transporter-like protein [Bisporella sp. PMI_857]|nr:ABC multidrug transporter-like protein [Bisporella sp. PMI_857]
MASRILRFGKPALALIKWIYSNKLQRNWSNTFTWGRKTHIYSQIETSPEYRAGWFSRLTFQWIYPLIRTGNQRLLKKQDFWTLDSRRRVNAMLIRFNGFFKTQKESTEKWQLLVALFKTFRTEMIISGVLQLTATITRYLVPFTLRYLITFIKEEYATQPTGQSSSQFTGGIVVLIGIATLLIIQAFAMHHAAHIDITVGTEVRAMIIALTFNKAMVLSERSKACDQDIINAVPSYVKPEGMTQQTWLKRKLSRLEKTKIGKESIMPSKQEPDENGQGWDNGKMVNLIALDANRLSQACSSLHTVWAAPVGFLLTSALLFVNLSYSALPALGFITISIFPFFHLASGIILRETIVIGKLKDQRTSLTQEVLHAVRFLKHYGWNDYFLRSIQESRNDEIRHLRHLLTVRNAMFAVGVSIIIFASILSFITYSLSSEVMDPALLFSSLALINSLRLPINLLPTAVSHLTGAYASMMRIQDFIYAEEVEESASIDYDAEDAIVLHNAGFTWEHRSRNRKDPSTGTACYEYRGNTSCKNQSEDKNMGICLAEKTHASMLSSKPEEPEANKQPFQLSALDLKIGRNELIAVIGNVGSGKSSLLAALSSHMQKTSGTFTIGASRALCLQSAWIQNSSVRDNIIFGKEFRHQWYSKVIQACALTQDFEMLPDGDMTRIGERGITISGGQKQRINIARAIYSNADIVLMDDPLSAVDAHVGHKIMNDAICGLLKDKCCILATHQLHILRRCDRIIWMEKGKIQMVGKFDDLKSQSCEFVRMISRHASEERVKHAEEITESEDKDKETVTKEQKEVGLMREEERKTKSMSRRVWVDYIKAGGGIWTAILVFALIILAQVSNITAGLWLSSWIYNKFGFNEVVNIGVYAVLGFIQAVLIFLSYFTVSRFATGASRVMLHRAIARVLHAPVSFFDTTPLGRIMSRFSRDIFIMDESLTDSIRMVSTSLVTVIFNCALTIFYYHYYVIALTFLSIMVYFLASFSRASLREIRWHVAVLQTDISARFSEALVGIHTIRAYGLQEQFFRSIQAAIDDANSAFCLSFANQAWLNLRLEFIGILLVFTTGLLAVIYRFSIEPSIAGLVLSSVLTTVQTIQVLVRQFGRLQDSMIATERLYYYGTQIEVEETLCTNKVRPTWPEKGEIAFENVKMRYRIGLPLVLKGLSLHIRAGERLGVVGRTGAGKSSIISALFRFQELSGGFITIDGIDIRQIGLNNLRSNLTVIPQDPTLFKGTVRTNLDPFREHTDHEMWSALRQVDLIPHESAMSERHGRITLDSVVEREGVNFSFGQRQLLTLARAVLRNSQIVICDEATSSVDFEKDQMVQRAIADSFKGKTLICIAHRLKTIIDYDRICVMDAGQIVELDTPLKLYNQGGLFSSMCKRGGIQRQNFCN